MDVQNIISSNYAPELVWQYLFEVTKELRERSLETEKMFQETDKKFKETDKKFKETDKKIQEDQKNLSEKFRETDKILTEKFQETRQLINDLRGHFDKQFGKLIEALVCDNTIELFRQKGITITHLLEEPTKHFSKETMSFDLLLQNDDSIVIIEAKTSLTEQKVMTYIQKMSRFKEFFKEFKTYKVYQCIAYVTATSQSIELAELQGLFLLRLKADDIFEFANSTEFVPICI
jgi:hypothetical protein